MDNIKLAIHNLQDSISAENVKGKDVENSLMQLHSTANLLELSTIPPNTFKRISELLRQRLLPLYQVSLIRTLQYSTTVLEFIQDEKLIPALKAKNEPLKQLWERLLISLVSGVLDYLDQSPDTQSRESIASVFYPTLTRIYVSPLAMFLSEINGGLLSVAYQLLVATVEPQSRNAARLRDHGISSKCLGLTLSQIRDFLAIESLLDIICTLIPPIKNGAERRSQFIKEVFDPDLFQCSKSILQILESITDGDWSITAVKIIEALASSDISFPQPFNASSLMICGISVNAIAPFYVDKNGFLANLDQDGKLETLHVPFGTVTRIVGSSISNVEFSILLVLSMPPVIGTEPLSVPSGKGLSVSWNLKKSQLGKFANVAKDRNLTFLNLTTRKLSLPGTHIAFNLPADKQPQELVSTQEKIHDMAKLLAMPSSPEFDIVTRSNNIAPQIVPKPPNGKPKKKSGLTKKSPPVKRRPNQTTTLEAGSHSQILSQGHPAVPIDVDKLPELKKTIPPSKTQKRRSATAGTMDRVTKLPDEPRRHEDRSLETSISPVDLKLENKKRDICDIEESEGIHVAEKERPNKRTRMDIVKTEGHNENTDRKKDQTVSWGDKNFFQMASEPIRSPSTKEILVQKKDDTWDLDQSLTLVVDDDYEQEKEVVEPSTFGPDIDMIDLKVQDDPIPARIPLNVFSKSSLKENKSVANVQPALHETQNVKVEISSPHHLPTKDRHNRPSVSFALPVESQRYQRPETSTFARKQGTYLASKYREIHKSWERSDHNKTTSRTANQHRYPHAKAEEKRYEEPEEPIERIAEIIKQIGETVVHQISRRFDSVRDELHAGHRSILQGTLQHLERMHEESTAHLANMVELEEEYALRCGNILKGFDDIRESSKNLASCVKNIVKEHNQQSLSKKFPPKLFESRTGILLNATIGSNRLD